MLITPECKPLKLFMSSSHLCMATPANRTTVAGVQSRARPYKGRMHCLLIHSLFLGAQVSAVWMMMASTSSQPHLGRWLPTSA